MAENSKQEQKQIRVIGIYIVILLALLRLLIYPLHAALQDKKALLGEKVETYRLKHQVQERHRKNQAERTILDKEVLLPQLYDKGTAYSHIQIEVLEKITRLAEKKGLTVFNFEMMETAAGKGVSEVPILVRLRGGPGPFIETLSTIEKGEKLLSVRSMEMTRSGQDQTFSLTISAYRLER